MADEQPSSVQLTTGHDSSKPAALKGRATDDSTELSTKKQKTSETDSLSLLDLPPPTPPAPAFRVRSLRS